MEKKIVHKFFKVNFKVKCSSLKVLNYSVAVLLLLLTIFRVHGEELSVTNFCFDGTKKGYRLEGDVIKSMNAHSGMDCIDICMRYDETCRSVNFRISENASEENCELLQTVDSEEPASSLKKNENFHYHILLQPKREKANENSQKDQNLAPSCKKLLKRNGSLPNGAYHLKNLSTLEEYKVYCHMTGLPKCGSGGWTLVMKLDGNKETFGYDSPFWTNKQTYAVEHGLEGLTEKQTKLASYWNTPFDKMCLGMKVNNITKWIVLNKEATSLLNVIGAGRFKKTNVGKLKWASLIDGSSLQPRCNKEGFNIRKEKHHHKNGHLYLKLRIGLIANNERDCKTPDSCIGFGTSVSGCNNDSRKTTCGNMAICNVFANINTTAHGFIFVQ